MIPPFRIHNMVTDVVDAAELADSVSPSSVEQSVCQRIIYS